MSNKYTTKETYTLLGYISDQHLLNCIETLFNKYETAKKEFTTAKFFENMIDPIKLLFDMKFLGQSPSDKIIAEINRKIDKTLTNAIGEFHEQLIGGIKGFKNFPIGMGYDIKADDNLIYADIKNKHNTVKGKNHKDLYTELEDYVSNDPTIKDKAYWVQIIAPTSFIVNWKILKHDKDNPKIFKASGDKFYELVTGNENAFAELCKVLPRAIELFLIENSITPQASNNAVYEELEHYAVTNKIDFITQLFNQNFLHYNGFPISNDK
jgi:hypothetical protein